MSKTAQLGSGLISTKGKATPTTEKTSEPLPLPINHDKEKRIAITVKLLEKPYIRMKAYGARTRTSNQDILEKALDDFLDKNDK